MAECFFVSDLHGKKENYNKLFSEIEKRKPGAVFMGGDLLPPFHEPQNVIDFITEFLGGEMTRLKSLLQESYPRFFTILGNDDPRIFEKFIAGLEERELIDYIHFKRADFNNYHIYGYSCIPPTPFFLKDWERYDVSAFADPGCIHPAEGSFSVDMGENIEYVNIEQDLKKLCREEDLSSSVFLFHSPPYQTNLDRAALDGKMIDHVPLDVNIGSIAIKRFIENCSPYITLHGHVHESSSITGEWKEKIGRTWCFSAAWSGPELALVHFPADEPEKAERRLL